MPVSNYQERPIPEESDSTSAHELLLDDKAQPAVVKLGTEANREKPVFIPDDRSGGLERKPIEFPMDSLSDTESATVVMPPDGGWGWVVVAASFLCNFIVDGILYSFGVLLKEISEEFQVEEARVALVGSLLSGFYLIVGPIVSALSNRYGFRIVTIFGSILAAAAFALSGIAMNVEFLSFTYGIVGGIGFGMIYSPSIIIVGFYFEKWRALATGIAVCGSGIGTFVMAPLTELCIKEIRWQGALFVHAGILLICGLCGILFRPLKPVKVIVEKSDDYEEEMKTLGNQVGDGHTHLSKAEIFAKRGSVTSLKSNHLPTAAEILHISNNRKPVQIEGCKISKSSQSLNYKNSVLGFNDEESRKRKRLSVPEFQDSEMGKHQKMDKRKRSSSHPEEPNQSNTKKPRSTSDTLSEASSNGKESRVNTAISEIENVVGSRRATITQLEDNLNRPIYRDDIFFSGSLNRIPQYREEGGLLGYRLSVTRLPTQNDVEEENECRCCPEAVKRVIATMLDMSLLKSISFILLCISGFLTLFGLFVPFMFLTERASTVMEKSDAVWLVSIIGITNTIGRILCGLFSSFPKIDALLINNLALTVGGISTIVSGISLSATYQYTYCVVFGFALACFASLRSIVIVELLGLERLTNAFGILLLFQGIAATAGSPLAGVIKELTGNYDASFYMSGSLILLSGIMLYPLRAIKRWEDGRSSNEAEVSRVV